MVWTRRLDSIAFNTRVHTYGLGAGVKSADGAGAWLVDPGGDGCSTVFELTRYSTHSAGEERPVLAVSVTDGAQRAAAKSLPVVLYVHGRGEDLGMMIRTRKLHNLSKATGGCRVVAIEFPGYGPDDGRHVSNRNTVSAFVAAYSELVRRQQQGHWGRTARGVVVYGYSLGTGIAMEGLRILMSRASTAFPERVILEGAFRSLLGTPAAKFVVGRYVAGIRKLGIDLYKTELLVPMTPVPLHFVHGTADNVCDVRGAMAMADQTRGPHLWLQGRNHYDVPTDPAYAPFLTQLMRLSGNAHYENVKK